MNVALYFSKMKTIVFLIQQANNSGPENVVLDICRFIDRSRYQPVVLSLRDENPAVSIEDKFKSMNIEVAHIGVSKYQEEFLTKNVAKKIKRAYTELGGDLIHAHCYHPILMSSYLRDIPTVATLHSISGEDGVMNKGYVIGHYMNWRYLHALKRQNCLVAISDYMMEYFSGINNNLVKIPNGVSMVRDNEFDTCSFKKSLGIDLKKKVVAVVGYMTERKNVTYIASELKKSDADFTCLFIGTGDKFDVCKRIVEGDERFRFEGFRKNVSDYLHITDLYVSASKSEGLPLSVLEAVNMGIPCLLSNIRPHVEIASNLNTAGVLCFSLQPDALCSAFNNVILQDFNNKEIAIKAKGIYSSEVMTRRYEEIYDKITFE